MSEKERECVCVCVCGRGGNVESGSGQRPCHDQCQVWGGTSIGMGRRVGVVANRFCIFVRDGGSPVACVKAFLTHLLGISVRIDAVGEVQLIVRLLREDSQNFPRQGLRRDAAHVSLSLSLSRSGHLRVPPRFCGRSSCLCSVRLGSWDLRDPLCWGGKLAFFSWFFSWGGMRGGGRRLEEPRHEGSKRVLWWWVGGGTLREHAGRITKDGSPWCVGILC